MTKQQLPIYFGSSVQDTSVAIPVRGSKSWLTDWENMEAAILNQVRRLNVDGAAIILPAAGLTLLSGQTATWDLTALFASNPLLVDPGLFIPVLTAPTGVGTVKKRIVPNGVSHDLYVDITTAPGSLMLKNLSGSSVTYMGFVMFIQYQNYVATGIGSI